MLPPPNLPKYTPKPAHVPDELVVDFDYNQPSGLQELGVYGAMRQLHEGPDIVWSPRHGGHWIVSRYEDVKYVQEHFEIFSHEKFMVPRELQGDFRGAPLNYDPPQHARYRAVLNPSFTPSKVASMRDKVRALTIKLVKELKPQGGCEFVNDFARVMPVTIFLGIVDLPIDRRKEFVEWATAVLHETDPAKRTAAQVRVRDYLKSVLDARADGDGDDLLTRVVAYRTNPRFENEDEIMSMASLLFFGGIDTVASELSFITLHLTRHPELRQRLIDEPAMIPRATEEFLRRFGLSNNARLIKQDFTYKGVPFKAGEMVLVCMDLSGIDERVYPDPMTVDFDREFIEHNTFGNGAHRCVGSPLARSEIQVFLEEFLPRIPDFEIDPARPPIHRAGMVPGLDQLHLRWKVD